MRIARRISTAASLNGGNNLEPPRQIIKMLESLEAFRLSCKQLEARAEEFEKYMREKIVQAKEEK